MSIAQTLEGFQFQVDNALEQNLPAAEHDPTRLHTAMRYAVLSPGKRVRPVLVYATGQAFGTPLIELDASAVAVELIHAYSLIHDDLPAMDDDDLRRGRPTCHKEFDEATAILAGDALQSEAFGVLAAMEDPESACDAQVRIFAIGRLARAAGANGLVGGQVDDLAFEAGASPETAGRSAESAVGGQPGTRQAWLGSIHARKTAALFQASIVGGAALAGATPAQRSSLEDFGRDVGIGFQIADDVLDADSEEAANILRLQGIDDARQGAEGLVDRALLRVEGWGEAAEPLRALARFAVRRTR